MSTSSPSPFPAQPVPQSVRTTHTKDKSDLTLGSETYQTLVRTGPTASDRDKNCDAFVTVQFPPGYVWHLMPWFCRFFRTMRPVSSRSYFVLPAALVVGINLSPSLVRLVGIHQSSTQRTTPSPSLRKPRARTSTVSVSLFKPASCYRLPTRPLPVRLPSTLQRLP